jgi:pimeloyl-ACP methyl ester carboxylesterase
MKSIFKQVITGLTFFLAVSGSTVAQENERLVDIDKGQLHVIQAGSGKYTVIFEAGFVSDLSVWQKVAPTITKNAQVLLYSRAGVGKSPARSKALTLVQHAEELAQLITASKVTNKLILVGHSYGGFVIRQFAASNPAQVAGLVFVDPANETLELELRKIDPLKVQQDQQRLASMAPPSAKADLALVQALFDQARLPNSATLPDVPSVMLTSIQAARNNPFFQETAPALQVKRDLHANFIRQFSNGAHFVTNRSGHHIQLDEPHLVIAAIEHVITDLSKETEREAKKIAKQQARQALMQSMENAGAALAKNQTDEAKNIVFAGIKASQFSESEINQLGFDLMIKAKQAALAEIVLRYNVEQFPQSDNAYDSHGEALLELQKPAAAKTQFMKAIAIGKVNPNRSPKAIRGYEENLQKAETAVGKK